MTTGAPGLAAADLHIRPATVADAAVVAAHRVAMFRDMGHLADAAAAAALAVAARDYLAQAMARGMYHGWLAVGPAAPGGSALGAAAASTGTVVAGAGVQLRDIVPSPAPPGSPGPLTAAQALLLNVYTEPAWRRRGVAERLVREALGWALARGVSSVRLHASEAGRALYARLGFVPTNEMIYRPPRPDDPASA